MNQDNWDSIDACEFSVIFWEVLFREFNREGFWLKLGNDEKSVKRWSVNN